MAEKSKTKQTLYKLLGGIAWVVVFIFSFILALIAVATDHWVRWEEKITNTHNYFGIFESSSYPPVSCDLQELLYRAEKVLYTHYSIDAVAALVICGMIVDVCALVAGIIYFFGRFKCKSNLWRRAIPTILIALFASILIFVGCLIFLVDMHDMSGRKVKAEMLRECILFTDDVKLGVRFDWSYYLALISGGLIFAKALVFGTLVYCC